MRMMPTIEHGAPPIDQTERALTLDTSRSFLVQAPAGSGKTELLTRRLLKLLAEVDEPEQILAITFTLAATAEMRARVLTALEQAAANPGDEREEVQLARAALANDKARGWNLLQQPQRLNIQTIDAVCRAIAHETPLLSRLGGSLTPTDKPQPLYTTAARRTLARLGGDPVLSDALRALLQLRGTSLGDCEKLIADMLDKRDQWGRALPLGQLDDWSRVCDALEAPLRRIHQEALTKAQSLFALHPGLAQELVEVLSYACGNVDPGSDLFALRDVAHIRELTDSAQWNYLCDFLLTKASTWRKSPPPNSGFSGSSGGKAAKERFLTLLESFGKEPELHAMLCELRGLPPQHYNQEESQMLRHMLVILRHAIAELKVVFAERGIVDFVELSLAAREVLLDEEGELSELAAEVAGRWRHLLVDEFQDTSRSQYELLTLLAGGWESAGQGTCFLVGDPMQSIYMFRQAEVELFELTQRHGLGEGTAALPLAPLQLRVNFRSHAGLVDRLNEIFTRIFVRNPGDDYQVPFVPSTAYKSAPPGGPAVHIWPFFRSAQASPEEKRRVANSEAAQVVSIVQDNWPKVKAAQKAGGEYRIAVLVRARPHLALIVGKLREDNIPFRAVEIEQLGERQEVRDLTALTRALLQPMARIAWLTVLRAPWCGLTLRDLHTLCGSDLKEFAARPMLTLLRERVSVLSEEGQTRAKRVHAVLETALRGKHRQVSLARWVERTWATLGGRACVDSACYENVRAFFAMLEDLGPEAAGLEERIAELCAQPDPLADERCGVQLMTIHKAKGLGFDVVVVPGLEGGTRPDQQALLRWMEQTRLVGESEHEEREFVVAPIGRNGKEGGIYQWIGEQQAKRENQEARRLLYVAATRARQELHLLGTANIKKDTRELTAGSSRSLLGIAWPALAGEFEQAREEQGETPSAPPRQTSLAFPPPILLHRLPAGWKPPGDVTVDVPDSREPAQTIERPRGSLAARAFGTVVHALLEELARLPGIDLDELRGWRSRALAMLRSAGLPRLEAEPQSAEVVRALVAVLQDPTGRWILGARADAQTEISWSSWSAPEGAGAVVQTLRGDRIFRAGEEPGSVAETHLWIVDYKTAQHGASGMDAFLQSEKQKYLRQLEAYAEVMRRVHGDNLPLRMALYYPLLTRLVWWAPG
jgi:ATP-dependent exoDNAse (exonuclease V) beta subunit